MAPSTLPRVLEPEVMDTAEEAADYDAMDHGGVNSAFADDVLALLGGSDTARASMLDVGTGTALIPIAVANRSKHVRVTGVDLAAHMLAVAKRNVEKSGLGDRVTLVHQDGKRMAWNDGSFDVVMSNSIIHHIPSPAEAIAEMWRLVRPGGHLFVRDLRRPNDEAELAALVTTYASVPDGLAAHERAMHERQRGLFEASLRASLTRDDVETIARSVGILASNPAYAIDLTSDRHWTLHAKKPS